MTPSPVTEHALYRWLERVRRVRFDDCPPWWDEHDRIQWGCRELGLTPAEARAAIAPNRVLPFIADGATAVRYPDRTLVVRHGSVVTVLAKGE